MKAKNDKTKKKRATPKKKTEKKTKKISKKKEVTKKKELKKKKEDPKKKEKNSEPKKNNNKETIQRDEPSSSKEESSSEEKSSNEEESSIEEDSSNEDEETGDTPCIEWVYHKKRMQWRMQTIKKRKPFHAKYNPNFPKFIYVVKKIMNYKARTSQSNHRMCKKQSMKALSPVFTTKEAALKNIEERKKEIDYYCNRCCATGIYITDIEVPVCKDTWDQVTTYKVERKSLSE